MCCPLAHVHCVPLPALGTASRPGSAGSTGSCSSTRSNRSAVLRMPGVISSSMSTPVQAPGASAGRGSAPNFFRPAFSLPATKRARDQPGTRTSHGNASTPPPIRPTGGGNEQSSTSASHRPSTCHCAAMRLALVVTTRPLRYSTSCKLRTLTHSHAWIEHDLALRWSPPPTTSPAHR